MTNCSDCGVPQTSDNSYKRGDNQEGFRSRCRTCYSARYHKPSTPESRARSAARTRRYRREDPERARSNYLRTYGLTPESFDLLLQSQGGVCGICGVDQCDTGNRFSVDHDHLCCPKGRSCGKCVRGILCRGCNIGIGNLGDSIETLNRAAEYLERTTMKVTCPNDGYLLRTTAKWLELGVPTCFCGTEMEVSE